jgi:hypothetical protein
VERSGTAFPAAPSLCASPYPVAKLRIYLQSFLLLPVNFLFPSHLKLSLRLIGLARRKHAVAHMGPSLVVERDDAPQLFAGLTYVGELFPFPEPFGLYDAVHALRHGVVRRLVVLRHADGYAVLIQALHIGVAAVLYASVGVVDKTVQITASRTRYRHFQRLQRIDGMKAGSEHPSHNLAGIGVCHQMKIADAVLQVYVGDVAYPKPVRRSDGKSLYQIPVFVEAVVAVRRAVALQRPQHQAVATQKAEERVAPGHHLPAVYDAEHAVELECAHTGSLAADLLDGG